MVRAQFRRNLSNITRQQNNKTTKQQNNYWLYAWPQEQYTIVWDNKHNTPFSPRVDLPPGGWSKKRHQLIVQTQRSINPRGTQNGHQIWSAFLTLNGQKKLSCWYKQQRSFLTSKCLGTLFGLCFFGTYWNGLVWEKKEWSAKYTIRKFNEYRFFDMHIC